MTGPAGLPSLELLGIDVELQGRRVLDGVTLVAPPGAPVGIAGPSGSGKSLLCLVAAGVLAPTAGEVRYAGLRLPHESVACGMVLQTHGLVGGLTAEENVALPLQVRGMEPRGVVDRARRALEAVGLDHETGRQVQELSGGQRQRVGIARALAGAPDVLVADEPTAELDAENRERVLDLLRDHAAGGRVVLMASDDPRILDACGSVYLLGQGTRAGGREHYLEAPDVTPRVPRR